VPAAAASDSGTASNTATSAATLKRSLSRLRPASTAAPALDDDEVELDDPMLRLIDQPGEVRYDKRMGIVLTGSFELNDKLCDQT